MTYLASVHAEAILVTYIWTGELIGSLGAVISILALSFPTYLFVERAFDPSDQ